MKMVGVAAFALAAALSTTVARADPRFDGRWVRRTSEWLLLADGGLAVGPEGLGLASGFETAVRYEHLFLGGDLSGQGRTRGATRLEAGAWAGFTFGDEPRWEFALGLGWHQYLGPDARESVAYATQRAGLRWRWAGRIAWTFGAAAYFAEDLSTHTVASPGCAGATCAALGLEAGVVLRVGFSLGG